MARRFTGRGRGSLPAPKRQIANDGLESGPSIATLTFLATTNAVAGFSVGLLTAVPAATLVRTRGELVIKVLTSGNITNQIAGAFGMIVVSENAFGAGITALPTPLVDIENDWFVYEPFALQLEANNPPQDSIAAHRVVRFDSRGMRKLKDGDVLAMVIEANQTDATTGTVVRAAAHFRSQFKL